MPLIASPSTKSVLDRELKQAENGTQGWLEKRSGGHHAPGRRASWLQGLGLWQKRYFVLLPSASGAKQQLLYYYGSEEAYKAFQKPQGELSLHGATIDLTEVTGALLEPAGKMTLHFTLCLAERELHLRTEYLRDYEAWLKALAAAGVMVMENAVQRHLLTSSAFKALQVSLELRRKDDERTLRQAAGLSRENLFMGSIKDLLHIGTAPPLPSSSAPFDIAQLDRALEKATVSGVDPHLIEQARLRRSASIESTDSSDRLGDGPPSTPPSLPKFVPRGLGESLGRAQTSLDVKIGRGVASHPTGAAAAAARTEPTAAAAARAPNRTNEQLVAETFKSWGCSTQQCAVM